MIDMERFTATGSAYDLPEPHFDFDLAPVGRGTPMGELLRRYWHPVYKCDRLKDLPVQVRALGDDIILFRKPDGAVGAVYPRCVHRGTNLLYGRVTENGIRCCYHGWTFEPNGVCTDQPAEPNGGGSRKNAVRQPWYPVEELYGLIFVYMGPLDKKPPLPRYDLLETIPEGWELCADDTTIPSAGAGYMPCNWLQHHENGMDPAHVPIVHEHQFPPIMAKARQEYSFEKFDDRVRGHGITTMGPMMMDFRVDMTIPNVRVIPHPLLLTPRPDGKGDNVAWTLPKDDTDTMVFTVMVRPIGAPPESGDLYNGKSWKELTFEEHQRFPGDFEAQVGQGAITFHSEEHLVSSDKGIVFLRRMLQSALKDVAEGRDPPLAFGPNMILVETWAAAKMQPNPNYVPEEEPEEAEDDIAPLAASSMISGSIGGRWSITIKSPMGDRTLLLTVAEAGGVLTGTLSGDEGDLPIADGKIQGGRLTWKVAVKKPMSVTLKFDVVVDGDSMTGTFKPGIFPSGPVTGVRV